MSPRGSIVGGFAVDAAGIRGHAYDAGDPTRRLVVELLLDGWPIGLARAEDFAAEASSVGDGFHGFGFSGSDALLDGGGVVEVRVANTGEPVGEPVTIAETAEPAEGMGAGERARGHVAWAGGLRLTGWVEPVPLGDVAKVRLVVERRTVAEGAARGFAAVRRGATRSMKARFDLRLPDAFADGRAHRVTVLDGDGRELAGSPCAVLCFADGLRGALMERSDLADGDPRVEVIDRILSRSVPFGDLGAWLARREAGEMAGDAGLARREATVAVLILGDDPGPTLASLEGQDHRSWLAVAAPETDGPGTFDPAACRAALDAEPDLAAVLVLPSGARLRPRALRRYAALAASEGGPVYADASIGPPSGGFPLMWPAYDPERQLEQGYAALAFAAPAVPVSEALRRGGASTFALFDRLATGLTPVHVPELLVELPVPDPRLALALAAASRARAGGTAMARAPEGEIGLPAVHLRRAHRARPTAVAVIQPEPFLPGLPEIELLGGAVDRLVVSHRPLRTPAGWRNVVVAGARNPSRLRATALESAEAAHCLLLDAGVEPEDGDALAEAAGRMAGDTVAVGGLVLDGDGLVLSAGLVLGPDFGAAPAFAGLAPEAGGHAGGLSVARSCGALDAAALLVDRAAAAAAGGFDPLLPEHAAADLCLKLRAAGGRLVVAPRARFVRSRAWRRGGSREAAAAELAALRRRWARDLAEDPFYHPGLNADGAPFAGLAWPPRPAASRRPGRPGPPSIPGMRR